MGSRGYRIDSFKPDDAAGVGQLFREVYGDGYPVKIVYDPEQLVAAFLNNEYIPVLARTPDNRIVGFTALYRPVTHNKGIYEIGMSLVLPAYRNTPIFGLMGRYAVKVAPTIPGIDIMFSEGVCNHTHTQRAGVMHKFVETAIEIDLMPAEAYDKEEVSGRVSTVDMFKTIVEKPHTVYVPEAYEDFSRFVLHGFDDIRTVKVSTEGLPPGGSTEMATQTFDFAQLARVTVYEAGVDFEAAFHAEEKRIMDSNYAVVQVWLKLSCPWVGAVIDILRNRGFFLGGILPRWFGEDGFLMQKEPARPNWEGINLYSERAMRILRFIRDDWEETQ